MTKLTPELKAESDALYESANALDTDKRLLLIRDALFEVDQLIEAMVKASRDPAIASYGTIASAYTHLAGYTVEQIRDDEGVEMQEDPEVDKVMGSVKRLVASFAQSMMSPEQRATAQKIRANVQARCDAGEDFDAAMRAELETVSASAAPEPEKDDGLGGLYL